MFSALTFVEKIMVWSPLEQFAVVSLDAGLLALPLFGHTIYAITNFSLMLVILVGLCVGIVSFLVSLRYAHVFSRPLFVFSYYYHFIMTMVRENFVKGGFFLFPYIFTLFTFLVLANLTGMIPYSFALTSHLVVTLFLSFLTFSLAVSIAVFRHGVHFFELFLPAGAPFLLIPFLVVLELISFTARLFSLAIRLFANIMSGHTLLKILANFAWLLFLNSSLLFVGPFVVVLAVTGLEMGIAVLQAYVFTVLSCIYLNEGIVLH